MLTRIRRVPSPALVISTIALFVAIGGISWAAATIGTSDIKNGAVTTKKLHNNAVATNKIKNNAVTGAKVNEGSLGQVPSATNADNATNATNANNANTVNGLNVVNFHLNGPAPIGDQQILDLNGLRLRASCVGGAVVLIAQTTVNDGEISAWVDDASSATNNHDFDDTFNVGDSFTVPEATDSDTLGQGAYTGGDLRTVRFFYNEEDSIGSNNCLLNGYAIG